MARTNRDRVYPDLIAYFNDDESPTQAQVAKELGISEPFLCMIKWREREPSMKLALDIVKRCRVPFESLVRKAS